ncbi:MAG: GNAT family N-acetyltransferase [Traorella sp.]
MNKYIDMSHVILKTKRLTLRAWKQSDLDDFFEYTSIDGVGQMAGWNPHQSKDETQMVLDSFINKKKTFALVYEGKVIGSLGIEEYKEENYPEFDSLFGRSIGYVLSKDYWGKGLMPEAVKAVIEYLFTIENLDFILVSHFEWNKQSQRVIEKSGFKFIKNKTFETRYNTIEKCKEYILYHPNR